MTNQTNTLGGISIHSSYTGSNAVGISCGYDRTIILLNTGIVMTGGDNRDNQLGRTSDSGKLILQNLIILLLQKIVLQRCKCWTSLS